MKMIFFVPGPHQKEDMYEYTLINLFQNYFVARDGTVKIFKRKISQHIFE